MIEEARSETKGTLTYGLDPVGNRQSLASTVTGISQQSASYNVNDQVLANTYDANGNTLGANGKSYAYDSMDRMTGFNDGSVKMVYDGDGNRVAKTAGGVTTQYLVDELNPTGLPQVMDEVVKSGIAQQTYLCGLRRISQTQVASGTTSYYGYDAHGDVRSLMNNGGCLNGVLHQCRTICRRAERVTVSLARQEPVPARSRPIPQPISRRALRVEPLGQPRL